MLEDFVELQKQGQPLQTILGTLADKYQYDIRSALEQGKDWKEITADLIKAQPPASGGVLGIPQALLGGVTKGLYAETPTMIGQALQATGLPGVSQAGKAIRRLGEKSGTVLEEALPKYKGAPGVFEQAGKMLGPSMVGGGLGALTGRALGVAKGLRGSALASQTMKGAALGGGTLFGLSQGRQAYEEALQAGLSKPKAFLNGLVQGSIEFGGEYLGTKYLTKLFGLGSKEVTGITQKIAKKLGISSNLAKLGIEAIGVEAGTEVGQQFLEELTGSLLKASPKTLSQITKDSLSVIPPTIVMTALTGGAGALRTRKQKAEPQKAQPVTPTGEQTSLVPAGAGVPATTNVPPPSTQFAAGYEENPEGPLPTGVKALPIPGGEFQLGEGTDLFNLPPQTENPLPPMVPPEGGPVAPTTPTKGLAPSDVKSIRVGLNTLSSSFNTVKGNARTRFNILKRILKPVGRFSKNTDIHAKRITDSIHAKAEEAQKYIDVLKKDANKSLKAKQALSRDSLEVKVQDVIDNLNYMTKSQLKKTKSLLKSFSKVHPDIASLADEIPDKSMAYVVGIGQYMKDVMEGQAPEGYEPRKLIEAPPLPDIQNTLQDTAVHNALQDTGIEKVDFGHPQLDFAEGETSKMDGSTLLLNPEAGNFRTEILTRAAERAYKTLTSDERNAWKEAIQSVPLRNMNQLAREAVKAGDFAGAYREAFKAQDKPWAQALMTKTQEVLNNKKAEEEAEAVRPGYGTMFREIADWEGAHKEAEEIYGPKNKQSIVSLKQRAGYKSLVNHIAKKFGVPKTEAMKAVGLYYKENTQLPPGEGNLEKFKKYKWAKDALAHRANKTTPPKATTGFIMHDRTILFGTVDKTTKKYIYMTDEEGNSHRLERSKIDDQKPIETLKKEPAPSTFLPEPGISDSKTIIPRKHVGGVTTIDTTLDAINYFLVNQHTGGKIERLKNSIRIMEERFKLSEYKKKGSDEILETMKQLKKDLTFSGLNTSKTVNPVDTRIIGVISHIDKLLADKEGFRQRLRDIGTVLDTLLSGETQGEYPPTERSVLAEMKSIRTYLDAFFTDFISSVTSVSEKGAGLRKGFMIKDMAGKEEGDFLTVLYSYTDGKNDPKYALIQKRGEAPFIVPYKSLKGDWVLSRADLQAATDKRGGYGEIEAKAEQFYNQIKRSALTPRKGNLQEVLEKEFTLSKRFSQFFTGTAEKKVKEAGIKHESARGKYVSTIEPLSTPTKPNEALNERKRKARLDRLKKAQDQARKSKEATTYTKHGETPPVKSKSKVVSEILKSKAPKGQASIKETKTNKQKTVQDILDIELDTLSQETAYARLSGIDDVAPDISSSYKDYYTKRLEFYINHILGDHVKFKLGNSAEVAEALEKEGVTVERLVDRLIKPKSKAERELLVKLGMEQIVKMNISGITLTYKNLMAAAGVHNAFIGVTTNKTGKSGWTEAKPTKEILKTAFHEIMETLRHAGYLSAKENKILETEHANGPRGIPNEDIADDFAYFVMDEEGFINRNADKGLLIRAFQKIKLFLARVRNFMRGLGFQTSEDVFKKAYEGGYRTQEKTSTEEPYRVNQVGEIGKSFADLYTDFASNPDLKIKGNSFVEYLSNIKKGIMDTIRDKRLRKFEAWVVPPQWQSNPHIKSIFGIVEDSSEKSWSDISDLLEPIMPVLQDLKKEKSDRYEKLTKAIIASDKADIEFTPTVLKEEFGLDDELIQHYRGVKEVYDNVLDKFFDSSEKTVLNLTAKTFYKLLETDLLGEATGLEDTISKLTQGFIDKTIFEDLRQRQQARIDDWLDTHDAISNPMRGKFMQAAIQEYVDEMGIEEVIAPKMVDFISAMYNAISPMERQRAQYKEGFYFPRIRPAGNIAIKVMKAEQVEDEETGELVTVWREVDRFQTNPGTKTKQNVEKHKILTRESKKYGEQGFVFESSEDFNAAKETMHPSHVAIVVEPIIRTPKTFFEGVTNKSILTYLSYITTKIKETEEVDQEGFNEVLNTLHNKIDEDLKARSFARSRWIKRRSGKVDIEALLRGEESTKVVGGYDTDIVNVTESYTIAEMRNIARNEAMDTIHTYVNSEDIKKQILGDETLYKWYTRYIDGVLSPDTPLMRYSRAVKSTISLWYLGGRISSALIQMTQPWVTGGPELAIFENASKDDLLAYHGRQVPLRQLGEHLKRQGSSAGRITKALRDIATGGLTEEEKQALQKGIKSKVLQSQFINSLMAHDEKLFGKAFTPIVRVGMSFFQYAEQKSREVGYIASFRLAKAKGLSTDDAIDFATNYTNTAFHIYSSTNKPLFATGKSGIAVTASVPLALKGYQINYLGWIYKSFKNEYGKVYADKLIFSSAYMMLLGGMWAIPIISDLIDLLSSYLGIPIKKRVQRTLTNNVTALRAMEFGLPAAFLGIDMSGSAKLDLLPREWSLSGVTDSILGVWTSAGQKASRTTQALETGQYLRAIESAAPVAVENTIKALRYGIGKEKMTTIYGRTILDAKGRPIQPTIGQSGLMLMGFRPADLSETSSIYQATRTIENYWKVKHDRIFTKLKTAKDYEHLAKIIATDVAGYNQGISKYGGAIRPITAEGIIRALKTAKGKPSRLAYYLEEQL